MIDLNRSRADFLDEIEAAEPRGEPLKDLTDRRVATADVHVRVQGHSKKDLFPLLKLALLERFASVPRLQLNRDLLIPLRNALGNAFKHGNRKDPARTIAVGIALTRNGVLVTVTDEGSGFDVARTFRRFEEQEDYSMNRGAGFRNLHEAKSTVSYENGGRTLLLCFRPASTVNAPGAQDSNEILDAPLAGSKVLDPDWIRICLASELPDFGNGQPKIESCRVYAIRGPADDGCGNRYALRVASHDGQPARTWILTGKLHATEAAAEADFEAAKSLHATVTTDRILIPRPVVRLKAEPRLVLYDFDPWINLREYLTHRDSPEPFGHALLRSGKGLAALHRSQVLLRSMETMAAVRSQKSKIGAPENLTEEELRVLAARAEMNLATFAGGPAFVNPLRLWVERIREWAASRGRLTAAPIHGSLDWGRIHFGVDGRFYLYRFESCRRSDPGLDLGGFAADLLEFTLANHTEAVYRNCHDTFLNQYNAVAEQPLAKDDLPWYIALSLVERLGRAECRTKAEAGHLLGALETELGRKETVAAGMLAS